MGCCMSESSGMLLLWVARYMAVVAYIHWGSPLCPVNWLCSGSTRVALFASYPHTHTYTDLEEQGNKPRAPVQRTQVDQHSGLYTGTRTAHGLYSKQRITSSPPKYAWTQNRLHPPTRLSHAQSSCLCEVLAPCCAADLMKVSMQRRTYPISFIDHLRCSVTLSSKVF